LLPAGSLVDKRDRSKPPLFSICIPQYDRTDFLLKAIASYHAQTCRDFEICIADDLSPDGRQEQIIAALNATGLPFVFHVQEKNQRYDGNLRAAMSLATGRYILLMGNDDELAGPQALAAYVDLLQGHDRPGVVIPNFADYRTHEAASRILKTKNCGSGPAVAAARFRNFSFVSGILLDRQAAQSFATDRWDGSEYYQMYIGCRIIASGLPLIEWEQVTVWKDIHIPGLEVDRYSNKPRVWPCPVTERTVPFNKFGQLAVDAVAPYSHPRDLQRFATSIFSQILLFTYPFWLIEYRRVQSRRYALGIAIGMRPERILAGVVLSWWRRMFIVLAFYVSSFAGLTVPLVLFGALRGKLYRIAKR
jgi:glycosyltransferase involved in cell wall biosynthesis